MELNPATRQSASKRVVFGASEMLDPKNDLEPRVVQKSQKAYALPHTKLIGIPTIEGLEFIDTDKIIRCEGLQKCTLIVTTEKSDIISSYNIGKFADLLENDGFFLCHRSHLINLQYVKKYTREGYIYFSANSKPVPLARRKRCAFLEEMRHL